MTFAREEVARGTVGVNRICTLLGIGKETYYRCRAPEERFLEKYAHLQRHVRAIITTHPHYGVRRIHAALAQEYGIIIGRDTIGKLLKHWSLQLPRKIKQRRPSLIQRILIDLTDRVNLLVRTPLTAPFQAVTSDITKLVYAHGTQRAYLCTHKDAFGQLVYGWALETTMEGSLTRVSLRCAITAITKLITNIPDNLLIHQDQGSQYTSYAYIEDALAVGRLSYSTKGTPTDNSGQESFFGRFKDEWKDEIMELDTFTDVHTFVAAKIRYYNTKRLHTSIGYQSPLAFTKNFLKSR